MVSVLRVDGQNLWKAETARSANGLHGGYETYTGGIADSELINLRTSKGGTAIS